jgi:hypothetical protein
MAGVATRACPLHVQGPQRLPRTDLPDGVALPVASVYGRRDQACVTARGGRAVEEEFKRNLV